MRRKREFGAQQQHAERSFFLGFRGPLHWGREGRKGAFALSPWRHLEEGPHCHELRKDAACCPDVDRLGVVLGAEQKLGCSVPFGRRGGRTEEGLLVAELGHQAGVGCNEGPRRERGLRYAGGSGQEAGRGTGRRCRYITVGKRGEEGCNSGRGGEGGHRLQGGPAEGKGVEEGAGAGRKRGCNYGN